MEINPDLAISTPEFCPFSLGESAWVKIDEIDPPETKKPPECTTAIALEW
jgi:hypothetical protein